MPANPASAAPTARPSVAAPLAYETPKAATRPANPTAASVRPEPTTEPTETVKLLRSIDSSLITLKTCAVTMLTISIIMILVGGGMFLYDLFGPIGILATFLAGVVLFVITGAYKQLL